MLSARSAAPSVRARCGPSLLSSSDLSSSVLCRLPATCAGSTRPRAVQHGRDRRKLAAPLCRASTAICPLPRAAAAPLCADVTLLRARRAEAAEEKIRALPAAASRTWPPGEAEGGAARRRGAVRTWLPPSGRRRRSLRAPWAASGRDEHRASLRRQLLAWTALLPPNRVSDGGSRGSAVLGWAVWGRARGRGPAGDPFPESPLKRTWSPRVAGGRAGRGPERAGREGRGRVGCWRSGLRGPGPGGDRWRRRWLPRPGPHSGAVTAGCPGGASCSSACCVPSCPE